MRHILLPLALLLALAPGCTATKSSVAKDPAAIQAECPATQTSETAADEQATDEEILAQDANTIPSDVDLLPEQPVDVTDDPHPLTKEEAEALASEGEIHFALDDQERKEVTAQFKYYVHKNRKTLVRWLERAERYLPYTKKVFREKGLPEELAYLAFVESGYNPKAYSRAHAAGMWQFMPYTGKKFGLKKDWWIDERLDPFKATYSAAEYLTRLHNMFDDWYLALAAYNAGEGKISRALKGTGAKDFFELTQKNGRLSHRAQLRRETRNYVPKFLAFVKIMRNLESLGFKRPDPGAQLGVVPVEVKGGTDLLALAKASGLSWKQFAEDNRAFRRYVSPIGYSSTVYLPQSSVAQAKAFLQKPGAVPYAGYVTYKVRRGDCWSIIARRYGVPVSVLKKVNNRRSNLLKPGQRLLVPGRGSVIAASPISIPAGSGSYVVRRGDTLSVISQATGVSVRTLMAANNIRSARSLRAGQKLVIPGGAAPSQAQTARRIAAAHGTYTVRRGDTLSEISHSTGVSVASIMRANGLTSARSLRAGQKLDIPGLGKSSAVAAAKADRTRKAVIAASSPVYTIRRGDTLSAIARLYGVSVRELMTVNNLRSSRNLQIGQKLKIPGKAPAAVAAATVYKVRSGDTVWSIARRFGVSPTDILRWNNMSKRAVIRPGDQIKLYR